MLIRRVGWHIDTDVVVIGYGAAGATAAITAHDAGAEVIILEKQEEQTPITNSILAGGVFICPSDAQEGERYMRALYQVEPGLYWTDLDTIYAWATYTAQNRRWLEDMGAVSQLDHRGGEHNLPGTESIDVYRFRGMGPGMMKLLYSQVNQRSIPVVRGMRATNLLTNARGEVIGVAVLKQAGKQRLNVRARRAVILATGGFEFDEQIKLQYLKVYPYYFTGALSLTGDGIRMSLDVGAQLWHMNCCSAGCVMKFPEVPTAIRPGFGGPVRTKLRSSPLAGYIVTDRYGNRYSDENFKFHSFAYELTLFDSKKLLYPRIPSYWIFDHKRIVAGALATRSGPRAAYEIYKWSNDNSEELERGWIRQGDTVEDLARKLNMEPEILVKTVRNYNLYCKNGADAEFDREPRTLIPLSTPPYYAVKLWPGGPNTQGGPRRNAKAQVVHANGLPIPRLYVAGELGSIYGMLYPQAGGNLAECFAFGRIAGENASHCHPL